MDTVVDQSKKNKKTNTEKNISTVKNDITHLKEQFLGVLGAIAKVNRAYVVVQPTRGMVEMQEICSM